MNVELDQECFEHEWKSFVSQNSRAVFQTALLITADPKEAEAALVAGVNDFDLSRQPQPDDLQIWEEAIVKLSVAACRPAPPNGEAGPVYPLLQRALWPVVQLANLPRFCFVIRLLLGYSIKRCANILGVQESEIPALIAEAAVQLRDTTAASTSNGAPTALLR